MANTKNLDSKLQSVKYTTSKIVEEINKLKTEGKSAIEIYSQMNSQIESALKSITKAGDSAKKSYDQLKNQDPSGSLDQYIKNLQSLAGQFQKVEAQQTKIFSKAEKERAKILKRQENLRNRIAAKNKERTKKVEEFETRMAKRRAETLARIEKKAQAKRESQQRLAEKNQIASFNRIVAEQKAAERQKTQQLRAEEAKRKQSSVSGGFKSQFTGRAIGGAIGSLTKYLGIYQVLNTVVAGFNELTIGSIKQSIQFEKSLAGLSAVAGATNEEVSQLSENALDVAGSTKFTAEEIVSLQTELAKLGFTADDIVESTSAIAQAAQALNSPLDQTALLIGKVRNQFGLMVEQTTQIADTLVTTINESALSMDSFATAIQYVGPIAAQLGLDLQQTAGAMAVLADNGFTASRIGTGLRGILTELGKTGGDAESQLKDLAEAHINLAEAADLVGKRNAAQLLTLLENLDAIEESNTKYYQQGRALESSAKQIDTFSGQLDILTAAWRRYQVTLGESIIESNIILRVLEELSPKAAQAVRGFQRINEIGFSAFNQGVENIVKGADEFDEVLRLAGVSIDEYDKALETLETGEVRGAFLAQSSKEWGEQWSEAIRVFDVVEGIGSQIQVAVRAKQDDIDITKGQELANKVYEKSVESLIKKSAQGINVNQEIAEEYTNLGHAIDVLDKKIKTATGSRLTQLRAEKAVYEQMRNQLNNSLLDEEQILEARKKQQSSALKLRLDEIKRTTQAEVDFLNERAKIETALANGDAEKIADIESERRLLIAQAYAVETDALTKLTGAYPEFIKEIEDAIDKSEKLSNVKTSDMMSTIQSAAKDYADQINELNEQLKAGTITTDEYNSKRNDLFDGFQNNINAFRDLLKDAPEVLAFFDDLLEKTLGVGYISPYDKKDDDKEKEKEKEKAEKAAKEELKRRKKLAEDIARQAADVAKEYNKTILENKKAELDAELDAIRNKYKIENEILKSNLDNQFITESQFRAKSEELRKKQLQAENKKNEEIFKAEKKSDQANIAIETIEALASNTIENFKSFDSLTATGLTAAGNAVILASGALKMDAVRRRKFYGVKFEEGGMVEGPSHSQGGVPFTVQGQGGYEMEGGEFIVNKKAASLHRQLLESINNSAKPTSSIQPMKFATGGIVTSNTTNVNGSGQESVNYLKAIAEATTSTAIQSNKPVRAFISNKDLRTNETERILRERNDRI